MHISNSNRSNWSNLGEGSNRESNFKLIQVMKARNTSSYQAIKSWRIQGVGLIYFRKDQTSEVNKLVVYYQAFCFFLRTCNL